MMSVKLSLVKVMTASGGGFQFGSDCSFMYSTMPVEAKKHFKIGNQSHPISPRSSLKRKLLTLKMKPLLSVRSLQYK